MTNDSLVLINLSKTERGYYLSYWKENIYTPPTKDTLIGFNATSLKVESMIDLPDGTEEDNRTTRNGRKNNNPLRCVSKRRNCRY